MGIKLITICTLALLFITVNAGGDRNIFDNDSDFMQGFETGLFLRQKGGKLEDYDCAGQFKLGKNAQF